MSDSLQEKKPGLSGPLKLMAISAAGAILGFGLCSMAMMQHQTFSTVGAIAFCLSVPVFIGAVIWLLVQLIRRAIRS